jgi:hypothetical protein
MPFISENKLEEALVAAAKNPVTAPDFYRLLLDSDLLVLGTVNGQQAPTEKFHAEAGSSFNFVTGERDGRKFLPIFSSLTRMQAYVKEESKYLRIKGRDLLETTRGAPIVLNPDSEYGKVLSAEQVELLLNGSLPQSKVFTLIGDIDPPAPLVKALAALFSRTADVSRAWIIHIAFADQGGVPHPLVGVETSGDMAALVAQMQSAAEKTAPGMMFDVERVDRQRPSGIAKALLQAEPFYPTGPGRLLN